jgi:hypothetical protein
LRALKEPSLSASVSKRGTVSVTSVSKRIRIKEDSQMKAYLLAGAVAAATVATPTLSFAYYHHRHHGYFSAPYGHGYPAYTTRYGRYPAYTYDPDPRLRAQLRTDFNRGVDFPGGR